MGRNLDSEIENRETRLRLFIGIVKRIKEEIQQLKKEKDNVKQNRNVPQW